MPGKRLSTTLPPEIFEAVEHACRSEARTRSELIRVALLRYLSSSALPDALLDRVEDHLELQNLQAQEDIAASREDIEAGSVRGVGELLAELEAEQEAGTAAVCAR